MRAVSGIWLILSAVACLPCRAETQFPYELTVDGNRVEVRSGPGREYYVTNHLPVGTKIEVYRHDAGGWLAIRPTATSFSLVEKQHLQVTDGKTIAKVLRDEIPCRVGSRVSKVKDYVTHVQLRQGELVELYQTAGGNSGLSEDVNKLWVPIWPPAGEFRWVHSGDVGQKETAKRPSPTTNNSSEIGESESVPQNPNTDTGGWQPRPEEPSARLSPDIIHTPEAADRTGQPYRESMTPGSPATEAPRQTTDTPQEDAEAVRVPAEVGRTAIAPAESPNERQPEAPKTPPREAQASQEPGRRWVSPNRKPDDDVSSLELELAMMVSREMRVWRLDALDARVHETLDGLEDESDRVRARRLLSRISQFEDLLNRASEASNVSSAAGTGVGAVAPLIGDRPSTDTNTIRGVTYDGTGWLVPVHASKGTVPPYALLDPQGDVLHYISPTPGLNLQRYVRKQIGVFGNRGYIPALNKPHVTAQRVVDLDRHLR